MMEDVRRKRSRTFNLGITEITLVPGIDQRKQKQWFGRVWEKLSCLRSRTQVESACLLCTPSVTLSPHQWCSDTEREHQHSRTAIPPLKCGIITRRVFGTYKGHSRDSLGTTFKCRWLGPVPNLKSWTVNNATMDFNLDLIDHYSDTRFQTQTKVRAPMDASGEETRS